jgi:hypothetical protein
MKAEDDRPLDSVTPPRWAEAVLRLLLRSDVAETVSGDLLEEYRETVHPARGRWRADLWYVAQVLRFMSGAPLWYGLLFAALLFGRELLDTFAPPSNWYPRSAVTSWAAIALVVLAGGWGGWRTSRVRSGTLVAIVAVVIGYALAVSFNAALYESVIRHDPVKLRMFQMIEDYERGVAAGWVEVWEVRLMVLAIVAGLGALGGLAGKSLGSARTRMAG